MIKIWYIFRFYVHVNIRKNMSINNNIIIITMIIIICLFQSIPPNQAYSSCFQHIQAIFSLFRPITYYILHTYYKFQLIPASFSLFKPNPAFVVSRRTRPVLLTNISKKHQWNIFIFW